MSFPNGNQANGNQAPPGGALANYTLPGVISYLASEFTSLERFKIMTNLEKSEMKYRISQLTAELNGLRFVNEKQALRIRELEAQLGKKTRKAPSTGDKPDGTIAEREGTETEATADEKAAAKKAATEREATENAATENEVAENEDTENAATENQDTENEVLKKEATENGHASHNGSVADAPEAPESIPQVDFDSLRVSRQKLNSSINEIIRLLKPPSSLGLLEDHLGCDSNDFDELLDDSVQFTFDTPGAARSPQAGIFSRYTLGTDDVLTDQKVMFEKGVRPDEPEAHAAKPDESDAETVTDEPVFVDEPDALLRGDQ